MKSEEMQTISCDREAGMEMLKILEIEPKCSFCSEKITNKNFGGIFSKPTRVCCDNICCLVEAIPFEG